MNRFVPQRPSPALVLSVIAVLIALGGQAGALPGKHSVKKGDIANNAVTAAALAPRAVHARAIAPKAVKASKLAPDSVRGPALGPTAVVEATIPDKDTALDGTYTASSAEVACPAEQQMLGGGILALGPRVLMVSSTPRMDHWRGDILSDNGGAAPGAGAVEALCLK